MKAASRASAMGLTVLLFVAAAAPADAGTVGVDFGSVEIGGSSTLSTTPIPLTTTVGAIRADVGAAIAAANLTEFSVNGLITLSVDSQRLVLATTLAALNDDTVLGYRIDSLGLIGDADFALAGDCDGADGATSPSCSVSATFTPTTVGPRQADVIVDVTPTQGMDAVETALASGIAVLGPTYQALALLLTPVFVEIMLPFLSPSIATLLNPVAQLSGVGASNGEISTIATQTTSIEVVAPPAGELGVSLGQTTIGFGEVSADGSSAPAAAGDISYRNTLGEGTSWSVTVAATSLTSGTDVIPFTSILFSPGEAISSDTPGAIAPTAGSPGGFTGVDTTPGTTYSDPVTVAIAGDDARGIFTQSGSSVVLHVPAGTPLGHYTGFLQYTITG